MSGINPDGTLKKYATPQPTKLSCIAAATGDIDTLKSLPVSDLFNVDEHGNNSIIWAADRGQNDCLVYILSQINENKDVINRRGYLGNTALGRAARGGHVSCVLTLLKQDEINPNVPNEKLQYPLHFAAFKKYLDVVHCMLSSGKCDVTVRDRKGRMPEDDTNVQDIRNAIQKYKEEHC